MEDYIIVMIEDIAKEYFANNPKSNSFDINKAVLGTKLEVGTTKTEAISKGLEAEYPFIKNNRGFIRIDRKGFSEFEILYEEQSKHIASFVEIKVKYPKLVKSIEYYKAMIEKDSLIIAEKEKENQELVNQANELEQKVKDLENNSNEVKSKLENLNSQYDKMKEENDLIVKEYNEKTEAEIQRLNKEVQAKKEYDENRLKKAKEDSKKAIEEHNRKVKEEEALIELNRKKLESSESAKNWFVRHNVIDYQLDKSIAGKLFDGFGWFCGYAVFFYFVIWILDFFF
jgi:DNA repair exonuclease SbcCD ATPase subunit